MNRRAQFLAFMLKLTGKPGKVEPAFHCRNWFIHGVLVTLWSNGTVKVYLAAPHPVSWHLWQLTPVFYHRRDSSQARGGVVCFPFHTSACREYLCNLQFCHP